jgi:hypothetical protein
VEDIGIAVRARRTTNPERVVVIAAGSYTYGCEAAMKYLTDRSSLKGIAGSLKQNVEVVVRADVKNDTAVNVRRACELCTWAPH